MANSHSARHDGEQARAVRFGLEGDVVRVLGASRLISDRLRLMSWFFGERRLRCVLTHRR